MSFGFHSITVGLLAIFFCVGSPARPQDLDPAPTPAPDALEVPSSSDAQSTSSAAAREIYSPSDFERYAPRTALDMIERVPGFVINEGNSGRGLGQATGNLLINGDRIASKSISIREQMARIPADNVISIEVVDGSTLDIPGLSGRVADIRVLQGAMSGQFEWNPQIFSGPAEPNLFEGNVSISGSLNSVAYTVAISNDAFVRGSVGPAIFTDSIGLVDDRVNLATTNRNQPTVSGGINIDIASNVVANVNFLARKTIFRAREQERRSSDNSRLPFLERFRTADDRWFYEIGGDLEFPLNPGRLKLLLLQSEEKSDFVTTSLRDVGMLPTVGTRFARISEPGERIGRAEFSWQMWKADWQLSGEAAFNRLDQVGRIFDYDPATQAFTEIAFPGGVGGVREDRYESILSVGFPVSRSVSLQFTGGVEHSTLAQTNSDVPSRTFLRPKGSLRTAWAAGDGLDVNLTVAREVGQLDFGDFLASVNLSNENANAGNASLLPQQTWRTQIEVAKNFGSWGSAAVTLFDEQIQDLVLFIPVGDEGQEARGNLAKARRSGVRLRGTLQFEPLGFAGARLDLRLDAEKSKLIDPVTQRGRRFDSLNPFELRADFRHDVQRTDYAWGFEFRDTANALSFRVAQTTLDYVNATFGAAFVEHKNVLGMTMRLRVTNIFDGNDVFRRTVFAGPRNDNSVLFIENRRRSTGQGFNFTVSGSF